MCSQKCENQNQSTIPKWCTTAQDNNYCRIYVSIQTKKEVCVRDTDDPYTVSPMALNTEDSVCVDTIDIQSFLIDHILIKM